MDTTSLESLSDAAHASIVHRALEANRTALARVRAIARRIAEDPSRVDRCDRLAEGAAMSLRNLQRLFVHATGLTPARFVERARLLLAQRFLRETDLPLKAIAHRCGFGNEERMRRAFHRAEGVAPSEYAARYAGAGRSSVPPIRYDEVVRATGSNRWRSVKSTFMP
jgi:transcriptional regulator GlxA family with amidase domain